MHRVTGDPASEHPARCRAPIGDEAAALRLEVAALNQELDAQRRELEANRSSSAERAQSAVAEAWVAERAELLAAAQRIRLSRAWRLGHGVTYGLSRLTRRRRVTQGAVEA